MNSPSDAIVIAETRAWVQRAVIGLNLCPFAKAPAVKGQIRYVVTAATESEALLATLGHELDFLADADPAVCETTLLIHPQALSDFDAFNEFLDLADAELQAHELHGVIQVASFHPQYRFAGTDADDVGNATNRSPFPTLHLLREASVDRAVAAFPNAEPIFEANIRALEALGAEGWKALQAQCRADALTALDPSSSSR